MRQVGDFEHGPPPFWLCYKWLAWLFHGRNRRFEQRSSGTLWAGVEPKEPVAALAAKVERACQLVGLEPERRGFFPHVTLARWKGRRSREVATFLERTRGLRSNPFEVAEFILF